MQRGPRRRGLLAGQLEIAWTKLRLRRRSTVVETQLHFNCFLLRLGCRFFRQLWTNGQRAGRRGRSVTPPLRPIDFFNYAAPTLSTRSKVSGRFGRGWGLFKANTPRIGGRIRIGQWAAIDSRAIGAFGRATTAACARVGRRLFRDGRAGQRPVDTQVLLR